MAIATLVIIMASSVNTIPSNLARLVVALAASGLLLLAAQSTARFLAPLPDISRPAYLAAHPMDSAGWLALARVKLREPVALTEAVSAYEKSLLTGRYAPLIMVERLAVGIKLWPDLGVELKQKTAEQAYILWRYERRTFLRLARQAPFALPLSNMLETYFPDEKETFRKRWRPPKFITKPE
jgi:hypothetical protein